MGKLANLLKQPYPAHDDPIEYLRTITIIGVLVFLILWVFTPFNFKNLPEDQLLIMALLYSGTAYVTMLLCLVWIACFPKLFAAKHWTLGKELLIMCYQFSAIALAVWLLTGYLNDWPPKMQFYLYTWFIVTAAGILPYLVATSFKYIYRLRRHLREAQAMNDTIMRNVDNEHTLMPIIIPDLPIPLKVNEFLYAEARGNYLHIQTYKNGGVQEYHIRSTLKELEDDNKGVNVFLRCHRAFLVNMKHITRVEGNAAGCRLILNEQLPVIPVSRANVPRLRLLLEDLKRSSAPE